MAFKVQNMQIDPVNHTAMIFLVDQYDPTKPANTVNAQFAFNPPPSEDAEETKVRETAKAVLQQALSAL